MILYDYFRSTASYRVRIALNLKKIKFKAHEVHLVKEGGQQNSSSFLNINPQGLVPVLKDGDLIISQSMAILEYLEEKYPNINIFPKDIADRALSRNIANIISCDIHPLNNLRVINYLKNNLNQNDNEKNIWYEHWIQKGFTAIEQILEKNNYEFCVGNSPTIADICLIPQVYNANRFKCNITKFRNILRINEKCMKIKAFMDSHPDHQT